MNHLLPDSMLLMEPGAFLRLASIPINLTAPLTHDEPPPFTQSGSLATVCLHGVMTRLMQGATRKLYLALGEPFSETEKIAQTLRDLQADSSVNAVLLDIDSPGGSVNGTPELAAAVARLSREKYVYAYTSGMCCSAAFWVASQCDAIYAAPSARLGSVGVILPMLDSSEAHHKSGLKVEAFTAGKYKGAGLSGTSLSEEQRALLQAQVNTLWEDFKSAVTRRRNIAPEDMEGQTFFGQAARNKGFVDARADNLSCLQLKLQARHA